MIPFQTDPTQTHVATLTPKLPFLHFNLYSNRIDTSQTNFQDKSYHQTSLHNLNSPLWPPPVMQTKQLFSPPEINAQTSGIRTSQKSRCSI